MEKFFFLSLFPSFFSGFFSSTMEMNLKDGAGRSWLLEDQLKLKTLRKVQNQDTDWDVDTCHHNKTSIAPPSLPTLYSQLGPTTTTLPTRLDLPPSSKKRSISSIWLQQSSAQGIFTALENPEPVRNYISATLTTTNTHSLYSAGIFLLGNFQMLKLETPRGGNDYNWRPADLNFYLTKKLQSTLQTPPKNEENCERKFIFSTNGEKKKESTSQLLLLLASPAPADATTVIFVTGWIPLLNSWSYCRRRRRWRRPCVCRR